MNDFSSDGSGHIDSVTVIIENLAGDVYNSFICSIGDPGRRTGAVDYSENNGIEIGQIRITWKGNVGYELQPELKLNNKTLEVENMFPITVNKTLYGSNTMSLRCGFDWWG